MKITRRALLTAGLLAKIVFAAGAAVLWFQGSARMFLLGLAMIDVALVAFFLGAGRTAPGHLTRPDRIVHESGVLVLDFGRSLERARN
jgi:hypothetical protein